MTTYKPFDLEKCLAGEPLITKYGKPALFVWKSPRLCKYPLLVVINPGLDFENSEWFNVDGIGVDDSKLFMLPKSTTYYANVYRVGGDIRVMATYTDKNKCEQDQGDKRLKMIEFTLED